MVRLINSLTMTPWYKLGSLKAEWEAWRTVQSGFQGLVHFMWADRDWGFFDQLPVKNRPALCATFHACPDTLPDIVRDPTRLSRLSAIILMSDVQRPFFESCGVKSERIHVVRLGVDCEFYTPDQSAKSSVFTVLSVGNYRRNFSLLTKACALLEEHKDVRVKVVVPKSKIGVFSSFSNVTVISDISDEELRAAYREASCLLMTVEAATANNAVLEAMACGLPIVSEAIGGIPEYTNSACATICQPGSAEALVEAILKLKRNPSTAAAMGSAARVRAEHFDWPLVAQRTVAVYEAAMDRVFKNGSEAQ
jgi:glycosyltransferase involved in cell wall biosynthesis